MKKRFTEEQIVGILRDGEVGGKTVEQLCRDHGVSQPTYYAWKRKYGSMNEPDVKRLRELEKENARLKRLLAEHPHHAWAWDFMEDRTENGRKLRILTVVDEFTRRCLAIEVEYRISARFVADTLMGLIAEHGVPRFIRSDNGPEFIAKHLMRVLAIHGVEARHIDPGSPWQNGLNERFNGSLRDECLNFETFASRDHARMICKVYGRHYNTLRPHSSLGYLTPMEFAERCGRRNQEKEASGALPPNPRDLPLGALPAEKGNGPSAMARPVSRVVVHDGAPVASQQSRILRVDDSSVTTSKRAGKVPAQIR